MLHTLRRHKLITAIILMDVLSIVVAVIAESAFFCDQAADHDQPCPGFWSSEHMADLFYNAAMNWQSELTFGVVLVYVVHKLGKHDDMDEDAPDV